MLKCMLTIFSIINVLYNHITVYNLQILLLLYCRIAGKYNKNDLFSVVQVFGNAVGALYLCANSLLYLPKVS